MKCGEDEDLGEMENGETNRRLWFCLYIERKRKRYYDMRVEENGESVVERECV